MYSYTNVKVIEVKDADTVVLMIDLGFNIYHKNTFRILNFDAYETTRRWRCYNKVTVA